MRQSALTIRFRAGLFPIFSLLFLFFLVGCDKINFFTPKKGQDTTPQPMTVKGTVIAKINNTPITLEQLDDEVKVYNDQIKDKPNETQITTRDQKINYLKTQMVRRALLYQEALDRGLDRKEEVSQLLEKLKEEVLLRALGQEEANKIDVSDQEIEDYYNNYKKVGRTLLFVIKEPEERQMREIVVNTESEAKDILIQLLQGADFATLARDRSKSASAKDGGDLGFIAPGKKSVQFDTVAFSDALEVGKVSSIFKCPDGYYIIRLEAKRGGKEKSLSDMREQIKGEIAFLKQQKSIDDLITKLSRQAKIEIYEGEIK